MREPSLLFYDLEIDDPSTNRKRQLRVVETRTFAGIPLKLAMDRAEANDTILRESLTAADKWDGFDPIFELLPASVHLLMGKGRLE